MLTMIPSYPAPKGHHKGLVSGRHAISTSACRSVLSVATASGMGLSEIPLALDGQKTVVVVGSRTPLANASDHGMVAS